MAHNKKPSIIKNEHSEIFTNSSSTNGQRRMLVGLEAPGSIGASNMSLLEDFSAENNNRLNIFNVEPTPSAISSLIAEQQTKPEAHPEKQRLETINKEKLN
jgi:hypothetical protein